MRLMSDWRVILVQSAVATVMNAQRQRRGRTPKHTHTHIQTTTKGNTHLRHQRIHQHRRRYYQTSHHLDEHKWMSGTATYHRSLLTSLYNSETEIRYKEDRLRLSVCDETVRYVRHKTKQLISQHGPHWHPFLREEIFTITQFDKASAHNSSTR